jgi:hypothetical protein
MATCLGSRFEFGLRDEDIEDAIYDSQALRNFNIKPR